MNRKCYSCSRIMTGSCRHCTANGGRFNNYTQKASVSFLDYVPLFIESANGSTPEEKYDFAVALAKKHIETIESERAEDNRSGPA